LVINIHVHSVAGLNISSENQVSYNMKSVTPSYWLVRVYSRPNSMEHITSWYAYSRSGSQYISSPLWTRSCI